MSESDYAQIRAAFKVFDTDNSGTLSASELRAILSRGSNAMLSADEVDEVISEFDANGDAELSIHEFAKACFSLSDDEAAVLQAKLNEAEARQAEARAQLTADALRNDLAQRVADGEDVARSLVLKVLQWRLLSSLPEATASELICSDTGTALLQSRELLECFLSSGECNAAQAAAPETAAERWAMASRVLCDLMEHDPRAASSTLRMRLAVALALTFAGGGSYYSKHEPKARYDAFCGWHEAGLLYDGFGELTAWQMRYVVGAWVTHEEMEWARANVLEAYQSRDKIGEATHKMVSYRRHNAQGVSIFAGQVGGKELMGATERRSALWWRHGLVQKVTRP